MLRLTVCAGAIAVAALSQDSGWTRFRGPNGTGISTSTGLPVEFGPDKNVVWKTELPAGRSSPVLAGDRVFVTGSRADKLLTICLDRRTGKVLWQRETPRPRKTKVDKRNGPASPTPCVDGEVVVAFFADYGLVAYDHDGKLLWQVPLGPFTNVYGMAASPVIVGDRVFLPCDQNVGSYLLAVSKRTGKKLWESKRPWARSGHSTPVVYRSEDGEDQLILAGSFELDAYDVDNGKRAWWVGGLCFEMKSTPVLRDGMVYINGYGSPWNQPGRQISVPKFADVVAERDADHDGVISKKEMPKSVIASFFDFVDLDRNGQLGEEDWGFLRAACASQNGFLAIKAGGVGDMTQSLQWAYRRSVPQLPSPLLYGGVIYVLNDQSGLVTTLEPKTGKVITRGRLKDAEDNYYASPIAGDGKVYFTSENGLISVVKAGGLESLAVNDLDDRCYATPAIGHGRIYVRTMTALYCFGE